MYELTFLLSDPTFCNLEALHDVLRAAASVERPQSRRPQLRVDESTLTARFDRFRVHLRCVVAPADGATREAPRTTVRPELRDTLHRFELQADADPQRRHIDDVLWLVAAIAMIPGVIVVDRSLATPTS